MKNIYYILWLDAIISYKNTYPRKDDWKIGLFIYFTFIQAINLWIIYLWTKYFNLHDIPLLSVNFFANSFLDNATAILIEFALPIGILNYFLIFHNNRYEKLMKKYKDPKVRYAGIYAISIIILGFFSGILYGMLI